MLSGRKRNGGVDPGVAEAVDLHAGSHDFEITTSVRLLTDEAMRQSGISEHDLGDVAVTTGIEYALRILLSQLREAQLLRRGDLEPGELGGLVLAHCTMLERLGVPPPDPMSLDQSTTLARILQGDIPRSQ